MDNAAIIDKYLLVESLNDKLLLSKILSFMQRDVVALYDAAKREKSIEELGTQQISSEETYRILSEIDDVQQCISEYVAGAMSESRLSKTLLFLRSIPVIIDEIENDIEKTRDDMNGMQQLYARGNVGTYSQRLFMEAYHDLMSQGKELVGFHMYNECENFIDQLVLALRGDISSLIDPNKMTSDDLLYVRRLVKNKYNELATTELAQCYNCNKDCRSCRHIEERDKLNDELFHYASIVKVIDRKIAGEDISSREMAVAGKDEFGYLVKKILSMPIGQMGEKELPLDISPKYLITISEKRFDKILKRRYNEQAYSEDKDIYDILRYGLCGKGLLGGDQLLQDIQDLHIAYENKTGENEKERS